jgi:hypothetical protein
LLKVPDESTQSPDGHVALAAGREAQTVRRVQEAGQRLRPLHLLSRLGAKILSLRQELEGLARLPELGARPQPLPPHARQAAGQEGEGGGGEAAPLVQHLGRRVVGGQRPEAGEVLVVGELAEVEEADGGVHEGDAVARLLAAAAAFIDGQQIPKWKKKILLRRYRKFPVLWIRNDLFQVRVQLLNSFRILIRLFHSFQIRSQFRS